MWDVSFAGKRYCVIRSNIEFHTGVIKGFSHYYLVVHLYSNNTAMLLYRRSLYIMNLDGAKSPLHPLFLD